MSTSWTLSPAQGRREGDAAIRSKQEVSVGQRLVAARLRRGLAQTTVAQRAGVASSYLSRVESGSIHPTFRNVMRIADALEMPLEEFTSPAFSKTGRGACPVTDSGGCMLDLIRSGKTGRGETDDEVYSPRQVRLLGRFAAWVRTVPEDRVQAMEVLLEELLRSAERQTDD